MGKLKLKHLKYFRENLMKISSDDKLRFNICNQLESECRNDIGFATSINECTNYSNSTIKEKKWKICNKNFNKTLGNEKNTKGINTTFLKLSIPEGDYCGDGENMALNYIFECDETLDDLVITNKDEFDDTVCTNTIKMKTKYGKKEIIIIFII